jgi:hypothetical protein
VMSRRNGNIIVTSGIEKDLAWEIVTYINFTVHKFLLRDLKETTKKKFKKCISELRFETDIF